MTSTLTSIFYILPYYLLAFILANCIASSYECGGTLKGRNGVIHTPEFPNKFSVPITCVWIIDASEYWYNIQNASIIVYMTQMYAFGNIKFNEYEYYGVDYKVPTHHQPYELTEADVTQVAWVRFPSPVVEIIFTLTNLYGTHLRALDQLLDVYGFNITYEVDSKEKSYTCNASKCRLLGHCYAEQNFT